MRGLFSFALWSHCAAAVVLSAPTATITAQPTLRKRVVTTVGYYSTGSEGGTTLWGTVTFETQGAMVATSGSQFALCASNSCNFGSCSGSTYVMSTTAVACGSASSLTCSSNLLYTDVFDTAPLTNFFCDNATETGFVLYKKTPTDGPNSSPARSTSSAESSEINSSISPSASEALPTSDPTPTNSDSEPLTTSGTTHSPAKSKKSKPIGAIVGGVVGGVAAIGALIVAAIVLIRRSRNTPPAQPTYAPPPPQEHKPYTGMAVAPPPEKAPAATTYPYAVEVGGAPAPPLSPGPVPQYTPNNGAINELPAQRM